MKLVRLKFKQWGWWNWNLNNEVGEFEIGEIEN